MPFLKKRRITFANLFLTGAAVGLATLAIGVALPLQEFPVTARDGQAIRIDDVTVIDTRLGTAASGQTVIISGKRIIYAGPTAAAPALDHAQSIAGAGKYLIPGLWDSHIHTIGLSPQLHFPLLLANGVTTVRDMGDGCSFGGDLACSSPSKEWKLRTEQGTLLAPRIVATASYHVETIGDEDDSAAVRAAAAKPLIATLKARGDQFVKVQLDQQSDPALLRIVLREARAQNIRVAGHLPFTADLLDPQLASLLSIEHDNSLLPQCSTMPAPFDGRDRSKAALLAQADERRCDAVLAAMAERGTAYVPSHVASSGQDWLLLSGAYKRDQRLRYVALPQRLLWRAYANAAVAGSEAEHHATLAAYYRAARLLTHRANARGVPVIAGSDAMDPYVTHGYGLHDELGQLVLAGLTPAQALRSATWTPARHFGLEHEYGTVEAGKTADLVLLDGNPLENIGHAAAINTVVFDGRVYRRKDLDAMLAFVERQASSLGTTCKFIWAMIKPF